MKNGAVIVDVAIDQGGCVATSRPTTHRQPTYLVDGVVHYCVTNMPGAVGRTSTYALCNVTLPYVLQFGQTRLAKPGRRRLRRRRGGEHRPGPRDQPGRRRDLRLTISSRSTSDRNQWPCRRRERDLDRDIRRPI